MKRRTRLSALAATIAVLATTPAVVGLQADADPKPKVNDPGYDILFVRHAKSVYPVPEEELNALGIQQAAKLVEYLHDTPIRSVDSSIMVRTYQTADGVAADHDVPVLADEDLREVELVSKDERVADQGRLLTVSPDQSELIALRTAWAASAARVSESAPAEASCT